MDELHFLLKSASVPLVQATILDVFRNHGLPVDEAVIKELACAVCVSNREGTAFRRKKFYKENFCVIEPVEYILDAKENRTFQHIPVFQSLQQLLSKEHILDQVIENKIAQEKTSVASGTSDCHYFKSFQDGLFYSQGDFWSQEELRISLNLYLDDFKICNPLGTSRKKT